jgi:serpin B
MALGMLYNGAEDETKEEIAAVMSMSDYTPAQVNEYYQALTEGLLAVDLKTELSVANAIWSDKGFPLKKGFVDLNKQYYDAEVSTMDFLLPSALKAINDWCNEKTKGTIPKILDELTPPTVIANATYFKSFWTVPFEKLKTEEKPFYNQDGSTSKVQMMHQKELSLNYTHTSDYEFVRLPYSNGAFSMDIMLPKEGVDIEDVIESLDGQTWKTLTRAMHAKQVLVTLSMPKFK